MILSYNWLKELVDIKLSPIELAEKLNLSGLPVEEITEKGNGVSGVIVAKILKIEKHPNADKLSYCDVTDGTNTYKVVCGAQNITEGMTVPFATIGAVLPGDFRIKRSKIRGIESEGMLCSSKELGLSGDHSGILPLDASKYTLGQPFSPSIPDTLFAIEITPNRPDLLSMIGAARFIAAITGAKVNEPDYSIPADLIDKSSDINKTVTIEVKDPSMCPRYCARVIRGVKVSDSPDWLKEKLLGLGVRPINNIVDITNLVLFELNQPLHAFDLKKLKDSKIIIRPGSDAEKITALDGKEYKLRTTDLIIADSSSPIAIAGVMGGEHYSVTTDTTDIVLESAWFNPGIVRKTARSLGLSSDSSYRFERGIDIQNTVNAMNRAACLMAKIAGGKVSGNFTDIYPAPRKLTEISLRLDRLNSMLGTAFTETQVASILSSGGFKNTLSSGVFSVTIPGYRVDMSEEIDLIEEVAQTAGYDKIPSTLPKADVTLGSEPENETFTKRLSDIFISYGFSQAYNYSFLNTKLLKNLGASSYSPDKPALLKNPFNEEESAMKTTLIPDLIKNLIHNVNNEEHNVHLFEAANLFSMPETGKYDQRPAIGCITYGSLLPVTFTKKELTTDLYMLKTVINSLICAADPKARPDFQPANNYPLFLEYGFDITVNGKKIGCGGQIKEEILHENKLKEKGYVCEIDTAALLSLKTGFVKYSKLSTYPAVKRDLSLLLDTSVPAGSVETTIRSANPKLISSITLFDMYKGKQVPEGKKSLSYNIIFRSNERTLSETEINKTMENIISRLKESHKAELRS